MAQLTLKLKKTLLKRKVNGVVTPGYYFRVITNGTSSFDEICALAGKGMTLDPIEIEACAKAFCRDAAAQLKDGKIVDLGPLGKLYPAVTGKWAQDKDDLSVRDCDAKVNYRPSDDISAAIRTAKLAAATEEEGKKPTTDEDADDQNPDNPITGDDSSDDGTGGGGGNSGGGSTNEEG